METIYSYQTVIEVLGFAASQNPELLRDAEAQLKFWDSYPGFYTTLLTIAYDKSVDINIRWMSILYLKNGVDLHWRNAIAEEEKSVIRQKLLSDECLNEQFRQISIQSALIISKIARFDFPAWEQLFPVILSRIESTENVPKFPAYLTGHYAIKTLASKRLMHNKKVFQELTYLLISAILNHWINQSKLFLDVVQIDISKSSCYLESALYCLKMLRNLVVYGFNKPNDHPDAINFLALTFQQLEPFLKCRMILLSQNTMLQLCEKYVILLVKVMKNVLERHPTTFVQFIRPALECSSTYCFNSDFQVYRFERLTVHLLNLMKDIILGDEYNYAQYIEKEDEYKNALNIEAKKIISEFFTIPVLSEIANQLILNYFLLTKDDLECWENDPENYATEEVGESWKVSLRPCTETFFLAVLKAFPDSVKPLIIEISRNMPINTTNDIVECLKQMQLNSNSISLDILRKEAVYKAVGLAAFDLFDEIDFSKWLTEVLVPEMKIKEKGYYIIRRRVIWLLGQCRLLKMDEKDMPLLYETILEALSQNENLVVRLSASESLKLTVDDYLFETDIFHPYLEKSISCLFQLLFEIKDGDLKMSALHVLTLIIKRMGKYSRPHISCLINYLPLLWERSESHNLLRCAIVSCYVQIVENVKNDCDSIQPSLIPMISVCTDVSQSAHLYLIEDGLELWLAVIHHTEQCTPEILNLSHKLLPIIEYNSEHLRMSLNIVEAYIYLSPNDFLKKFGLELSKTFQYILTDLKSEGINWILSVIEVALRICPSYSFTFFQPIFGTALNLALQPGELPISLSIYLALLSRAILYSQSYFLNLLQEKANASNQNVNAVLEELFDIWLKKMAFLNPPIRRKLMALALANLLTSGSVVVHYRICGILLVIVEVLYDITQMDDSKDMYVSSTEEKNAFLDYFVYSLSNHSKRELQAKESDIVRTVALRDYLCDQMKALEQSVGSVKFEDLMSTVDVETKQQVQFFLQNDFKNENFLKGTY